ncbi:MULTISPECIES: group III truncated hemoglobin [Methylococcus]|jgi:hemoglobin|uniref:Hemoglobin n=1 Tax=Methylococcus capsulatus TaxID=414 RepID=A0AA35Y1I9_METCP|nr:group III truncated hemoglobin [Methylococcus capsulatus]UQN12765.1 group III truncated hemoglobin [Methylococcus capsulatus]CAI8880052.1 hemoglobin [Methylococcus capsulatus]
MSTHLPTEEQIAEMVRRFYRQVLADDRLRPIFDAAITDWDTHHRVVQDFWSRTLLDTDRYRGHPYPVHAQLPLQPEHFDIWLELFRKAAREVLPADSAARAIARAEHMAESFKAGMFSFPRYDGPKLWKPAR